MAIQNRQTTLPGIWAENAQTDIPTPPVAGVTYRDTTLNSTAIDKAWPFKEIVDSSDFNQHAFLQDTLIKEAEQYGIMRWNNTTTYKEGGFCLAQDGGLYQAKRDNQGKEPTSNADDWVYYFDVAGYAKLAENNTFTGQNTFNQQINSTSNVVLNTLTSFGGGGTGVIFINSTNGKGNILRAAYYNNYTQNKPCVISRHQVTNSSATKSAQFELIVSDDGYYMLAKGGTGQTFLSLNPNVFLTSMSYIPVMGEVSQYFPLKDLSNATTNAGNGYVYIGDLLIQWGSISGQSDVVLDVVFHKPFADTNYYFDSVPHLRSDGYSPAYSSHGFEKTTTSISVVLGGGTASQEWFAIGKKGA